MERRSISLLSLKKRKKNNRRLLIKICLVLPSNNPVRKLPPPARYRVTLLTKKRWNRKLKLIDNKWIDKCNSFSKQGRSFIQEEADEYVNKVLLI